MQCIRLLLSEGYEPDILYTSRLKRAVKSTWTILNALSAPYLPVYKSWRLNERNYGALTGLKKIDAAKELGMDVVQAWYVFLFVSTCSKIQMTNLTYDSSNTCVSVLLFFPFQRSHDIYTGATHSKHDHHQ